MRKLLLVIFMSLIATGSVYAFNLSFLQNSPVYYFTKADWALAESTAFKALNNARDNTKVSWRNPDTNAHGYVIPFNTIRKNNTVCRQMKIFSVAHEVSGLSVYQFCKINGDWKVPN